MIEGLKVTIKGNELRELCTKQANSLGERSAALREQLTALDQLQSPNTSNRPGDDARTKIKEYEFKSSEMRFIAEHIQLDELYVLDAADLQKLGISPRGW